MLSVSIRHKVHIAQKPNSKQFGPNQISFTLGSFKYYGVRMGWGHNTVTVSSDPFKKPAEVAQSENKIVGISLSLGIGLTLNISPVRSQAL